MINCIKCSKEVESERVKLLDSVVCASCAKKNPVPKKKGILVYPHKTGGFIQVVEPDTYEQFRADTDRIGQQSILRRKMAGGGRLM